MLNMIIQGGRIVATVIYPHYHLSLRNDWNSARAFGSLFGISKNSVTSKGTQSCPLLTFKACTFLVKFQSVYIMRWLDCCNSLLAYTCIPSNLCNWSRMQQQDLFPKFSQITALLCSHPWLPVVAHIRFKTLMPTKPKMACSTRRQLSCSTLQYAPFKLLPWLHWTHCPSRYKEGMHQDFSILSPRRYINFLACLQTKTISSSSFCSCSR